MLMKKAVPLVQRIKHSVSQRDVIDRMLLYTLQHLCFPQGRWGLGSSLWDKLKPTQCGRNGVFSIWSNFSWLNNWFYVLSGTVFDVQGTSCSPKSPEHPESTSFGKTLTCIQSSFLAAANFRPVEAERNLLSLERHCEYMKAGTKCEDVQMTYLEALTDQDC